MNCTWYIGIVLPPREAMTAGSIKYTPREAQIIVAAAEAGLIQINKATALLK